KPRINVAATVAKIMASAHSLATDFLYGYFFLNSSVVDCPRYFTLGSLPHIGNTINGTKTAAAFSQNLRFPKDLIRFNKRSYPIKIFTIGTNSHTIHQVGLPTNCAMTYCA